MTRSLLAFLSALLLGAAIIAAVQGDRHAPLAAYRALFEGAFVGLPAWASTLARTTPLLLTGLAVAVALAAGLFNIGGEGQMAVGGLCAAMIGCGLPAVPPPILLPLALLGGMAAGALWALLPVLLKVYRGAHEVITAILLNYVAANITRYLATDPLRDPAGMAPQTRLVSAPLPRLAEAYDVHFGLPIAAVAVILIALALRHTVRGFETRAVGEGPGAAETAGISLNRVQIRAFVLSGALAGLAGAVTVLGTFRRYPADFYGSGYGFDGLAVALLAGGSPWAVFPAALLFGALGAGAESMEFATGTPRQMIVVIQAILIVAAAARFAPRWRKGLSRPADPLPPAESGVAGSTEGRT